MERIQVFKEFNDILDFKPKYRRPCVIVKMSKPRNTQDGDEDFWKLCKRALVRATTVGLYSGFIWLGTTAGVGATLTDIRSILNQPAALTLGFIIAFGIGFSTRLMTELGMQK